MFFRILPFLIILLFIMVGSKALSLIDHAPSFVKELKASEAKKEDVKKETTPKEPAKKEEVKKEASHEPAKEEAPAEAGHSDQAEKKTEEAKPDEEQKPSKPEFSDTEVEILQSLAKRRDELEQRDKDISLKEASLTVIEKNIELKIDELKNLQNELKGIMAEYQSKEEEKVKSLVKIYESMKPLDAAKIFEQLQMSILVEVADQMKEAKLAQILAKMDTYKAKELTVELANRRRVKENS